MGVVDAPVAVVVRVIGAADEAFSTGKFSPGLSSGWVSFWVASN